MNHLPKKLFFDLETTGLGRVSGSGPMFQKPVSIWQLAYNIDGANGHVAAEIKTPFEKEALGLYKEKAPLNGIENAVPKVYADMPGKASEEELVKHFGALIKSNPNAILSGYNINHFDIPLMARKFQEYGLTEELEILKKMRTDDVFIKAKSFLKDVLDPSFQSKIGLDIDRSDGTKLETLAEAFGIDMSQYDSHLAGSDTKLVSELDKLLSDPVEAGKRYDVNRHISSRDALMAKKKAAVLPGQARIEDTPWSVRAQTVPRLTRDVEFTAPGFIRVGDLQIEGQPFTDAIKQASKGTKPILKEASDVLASGVQATSKGFDWAIKQSKNLNLKKAVTIGAALAVGDAILTTGFKYWKKHKGSEDRDEYVSATSLGKSAKDIQKTIRSSSSIKEFNSKIGDNAVLGIGTKLHDIIESEFMDKGFAYDTEVPVYDDEIKVQGRIDVLGKIDGKKIPIELKTISEDRLETMTEPEYEHASQANFYAHATGATGSYVFYVAAENTKKRKAFYIPYSPERVIRDVADFRSALISSNAQNTGSQKWLMQMEDFFGSSSAPEAPYVDPSMIHSQSKVRDQATRNSHLFPTGTKNYGNNTANASRYNKMN